MHVLHHNLLGGLHLLWDSGRMNVGDTSGWKDLMSGVNVMAADVSFLFVAVIYWSL